MTATDTYIAVPCALHSQYELAIMHKTRSCLRWLNKQQQIQTRTVTPVDLITRNKQEYLKALSLDHEALEIRLDKIISLKAC